MVNWDGNGMRRPGYREDIKNCYNCKHFDDVKYCEPPGYAPMKQDEPEYCVCDLHKEE